ncbi:MAG: hypothetical protein KGD61_08235, partial [Candidatus Lokiarchaeota archaeon]|nr:hypothetical protein [Candidatus Lokiarchaeota archaeon]
MDDLTDDECITNLAEVEAMENAWAEQSKAMANKAALEEKFKILNIENKGVNVVGKTLDSTNNVANEDMYATIDYR